MSEVDALSQARFGDSLFLNDFPTKIRVLTLDPMVYVDKYANTRYAFVVFNLNEDKVQVLNKSASFPRRFQEIHTDDDFGRDIRKIDLKIATNGLQGTDIRYTITPIGMPHDLTQEQLRVIKDTAIDLQTLIRKIAPNALRLSEINSGKQVKSEVEPEDTAIVDDIELGKPVDLSEIPF
jgi:hypothetical protein